MSSRLENDKDNTVYIPFQDLRRWGEGGCLKTCPICWMFADEGDWEALSGAGALELMSLKELWAVYEVGCKSVSDLIERLFLTTRGAEIDMEAMISVEVTENNLSGYQELVFTITDTRAEPQPAPWLGPGYTIEKRHAYDISCTLFTTDDDVAANVIKAHVAEIRKTGGTIEAYAALSYVWGMAQPVTNRENLATRYQKLDTKTLPQTIRDAIYVTHRLNIPYLWVDSLCIVQDDPTDIAFEIAKMAKIYKHATVTISAAKAPHCDAGFLEPRVKTLQMLNQSLKLPFHVPGEQKHGTIYLTADSTVGHDISWQTGHSVKLPVDSRAWTLQESWLSPRLLTFGHGPTSWKCLSMERIEGFENAQTHFFGVVKEDRKRFFRHQSAKQIEDDEGEAGREDPFSMSAIDGNLTSIIVGWQEERPLSSIWNDLVEQYTRRSLTVPSDKLPAISGIASEFAALSNDAYYAGLWRTSLAEQLLWQSIGSIGAGEASGFGLGLPEGWRAPSWSWAAVDGWVSFKVQNDLPLPFTTKPYEQPEELIIHDIWTKVKDTNVPFGEVTSGALVLSGRVNKMTWDQFCRRFEVYSGKPADFFEDYVVLDGGMANQIWSVVTAVHEGKLRDEDVRMPLYFLELSKDGPQGIVLVECDGPEKVTANAKNRRKGVREWLDGKRKKLSGKESFRHVITPLSDAGYHVLAPDYRGAGKSSKPLTGYTKSQLAEDLHILLHVNLGIKEKVHIVGHDIGGMIAWAYAARYPDDVASLNWGECPLPGTQFYADIKGTTDVFHFVFHQILDLPEALIAGRERLYLQHFFEKMCVNSGFVTGEDLDEYTRAYQQPGAIRAGLEVYRAFEKDAEENRDILQEKGKVKVRSVGMFGAGSFLKPRAKGMVQEVVETDRDIITVEDAGHYIAEENSGGFVDGVLNFIGGI
ncbi:hypothetical protein N0V90_006443 [Kalmusia sp. IMI 367209]|nr:hypothetical protein N0V90_006443 [Kalmusia sp. IMI 367209]